MSTKVSVIVPTYNAEHTLGACLESLLAQTFSDLEILVVNDGSTDGTAALCDKYASADERVIAIHKKNEGVSSARNAALDAATGEYIVFADSDDTVSPEYIFELMQWKNFDFVTAGFHWQDREGAWHLREFPNDEAPVETIKKFPSVYMGKYYFGSPWATLMKRGIVEHWKLRFNTKIHSGEDTLFIFQYLQHASEVKIVPKCGYNYCYYPTSLANTKHADYWQWKIKVEEAILEFFSPEAAQEQDFLLERIFGVLCDLLRDYSKVMNRAELVELYSNTFFADCVDHMRKRGHLKEKIMIFAMEKKDYAIYEKYLNASSLIHRAYSKAVRELASWRNCNGK